VDAIARRYGKWPHEVVEEATPFDLRVLSTALEYEAEAHRAQDGGRGRGRKSGPESLSLEDMKAALSSTEA